MAADISLAENLSAFERYLENERPVTALAYRKLIDRLSRANAGNAAPGVGEHLPAFRLPDECGKLLGSDQLLTDGPLVISLNRGHWCGFCVRELAALQSINSEVRLLGGRIVAITPERQRFAGQLKAQSGLEFPVLSDVDNGYALSIGLAIWCGEEIKAIYAGIGFDLALYQGNPGGLLPIPATFVVAADGRISGRYVDVDFRRRMAPDDILTVLRNTVQP